MYKNRRVVVVTPSGRLKYLEILKNYITRDIDSGLVDEWQLWLNTDVVQDVNYINELSRSNPKIVIKKIEPKYEYTEEWRQWNLHSFYRFCTDDAIYIRIDDDVVYLEQNAIKELVDFKIESPQYFNIYGNCLNNSLMTSMQMRMGNCTTYYGIAEYNTYDQTALQNGYFIKEFHEQIIQDIKNNNIDKYKFGRWQLLHFEHHSITVSCFDGNDLKKAGSIADNDEIEFAVGIPNRLKMLNCVYGGRLFVHHFYLYQRRHLETFGVKPDIFLDDYLSISQSI